MVNIYYSDRKAESWIGSCSSGIELLDLFKEDLKEKYKDEPFNPAKDLRVYAADILDENEGQYLINKSYFTCKDGMLSYPCAITSLIPQQAVTNIEIRYLR